MDDKVLAIKSLENTISILKALVDCGVPIETLDKNATLKVITDSVNIIFEKE